MPLEEWLEIAVELAIIACGISRYLIMIRKRRPK
jgi:hypothetical protein